jgi:hypothetical protein
VAMTDAMTDDAAVFEGRTLIRVLAGVALVGWAGVVLGLSVARVETHFAYLTAFAFVASIALGALLFLMIMYAVGAKWNAVIRRLNECIVSVIPVLAVCFLPIAFGLRDLYPWTAAATSFPEHEQHAIAHKQAYLNIPFFLIRAGVYFALWTLAALVLCRWSTRRDARALDVPSDVPHAKERAFSSAVLPLVALALTFAAFDWLMSLQPFWISTVFGVYYFAGGFVASLGLIAVLSHLARRSSAELIRPPHFYALGRLMFGFTVFWVYIAFFQAMLMNLANRPEEVAFYVRRLDGGWKALAWALLFVRFVIPFFVLLPRDIKFNSRAMAIVGSGLIVGHYLDIYWLVMPVQAGHGLPLNVWDVAAVFAIAGTCGLAAALWLRGRAVVPIHDPVLEHSALYRSPL